MNDQSVYLEYLYFLPVAVQIFLKCSKGSRADLNRHVELKIVSLVVTHHAYKTISLLCWVRTTPTLRRKSKKFA